MSIRFFFPVVAAVFSVSIGTAAQQNSKLRMDVGKAPVTDGRQMYVSYCASCHGMDGKGNGPVAESLKTPPTNLTQLSNQNHGKYPAHHVVAVLHGGTSPSAHGTALMPVWGPIFAKIDKSSSPATASSAKLLRISNLNRYIQGIQEN